MTTPARSFSFAQWYTFWLGALIFLLPSNLFLKFFESSAYVHGLLVDYLLPKLYLSDVIIFVLLGTWLVEFLVRGEKFNFSVIKKRSKFFLLLGTLLLLIFCRQLFTPKPLAAIWLFLKYVEMGFLAAFLIKHKEIFLQRWVKICFSAMVLFQSLLAIFQFWQQSSFFPSYLFLGETHLVQGGGIATGIFNGVEKILPYGTTAHPNILGGVLAISLVLLMRESKTSKLLRTLLFLIAVVALFFTQSLSAWLVLGIGILLKQQFIQRNKGKFFEVALSLSLIVIPLTIGLAQIFPENIFIVRRATLLTAALNMSFSWLFWGVGMNQFTVYLESFAPLAEVVRFVQPVHHAGLLWLAEMGLLGIGLISTGVFLLWKRMSQKFGLTAMLLLPIFVFDHYLITTQTGLLLAIFLIASFSQFKDSAMEK